MSNFKFSTMLCMLIMLFINAVWAAQITVINQCPYDVSCAIVDGAPIGMRDGPNFVPIDRSGSTFDAKMNLGQTMKCGKPAELPQVITQLEWKLDSKFWYDVSLVNGNPFRAEGFEVRTGFQQPPTGTAFPRCWDIYCAQNADCSTNQVYLTPTDDRNPEDNPMRDCPTDQHITFFICLNEAQKNEKHILGPPMRRARQTKW